MENVTGYTKVDIAGIKGTTVDSNTLYIDKLMYERKDD